MEVKAKCPVCKAVTVVQHVLPIICSVCNVACSVEYKKWLPRKKRKAKKLALTKRQKAELCFVKKCKKYDIPSLEERRLIPYCEYLESKWWKYRRKTKIRKVGKKCEQCGVRKYLQVHHLNYSHLWDERDEDLQVLCRECHWSRHESELHPKEHMASIADELKQAILEERTNLLLILLNPPYS